MILGISAGAAVAGGGGGGDNLIVITAGSGSGRVGFSDAALSNVGTLESNGTDYDVLELYYDSPASNFILTIATPGGGDPAPGFTLPFNRLEWTDNATTPVQVTQGDDPSSSTFGGGRKFQWPAPSGIVGFTNGVEYTITLVP